jgi:hypothetical protein
MIDNELKRLISNAGRVAARERDAEKTRERKEREQRKRDAQAAREKNARARVAAQELFAWLASDEAHELRAAMHDAGIDEVPFGGWIGHWQLELRADPNAPLLVRFRAPYVGVDRRAANARALAKIASPDLVLGIANEIREGRILASVAAGLKRRARTQGSLVLTTRRFESRSLPTTAQTGLRATRSR